MLWSVSQNVFAAALTVACVHISAGSDVDGCVSSNRHQYAVSLQFAVARTSCFVRVSLHTEFLQSWRMVSVSYWVSPPPPLQSPCSTTSGTHQSFALQELATAKPAMVPATATAEPVPATHQEPGSTGAAKGASLPAAIPPTEVRRHTGRRLVRQAREVRPLQRVQPQQVERAKLAGSAAPQTHTSYTSPHVQTACLQVVYRYDCTHKCGHLRSRGALLHVPGYIRQRSGAERKLYRRPVERRYFTPTSESWQKFYGTGACLNTSIR